MKRLHLTLIILAVLLLAVSALPGQKLAKDVNGYRIQMPRYFTAVHDSIPAQAPTVRDSLLIPDNACEVSLWFIYQPGYIYTGPAKTTPTAAEWIYVPKGVVIDLPYQDPINPYIKYRSQTGANCINVIIKRL